jgi:hypothetical protein
VWVGVNCGCRFILPEDGIGHSEVGMSNCGLSNC